MHWHDSSKEKSPNKKKQMHRKSEWYTHGNTTIWVLYVFYDFHCTTALNFYKNVSVTNTKD